MRMLSNRVVGSFYDLTELSTDLPQSARWDIGYDLYEAGATGLLYRMAEIPSGEFISIFNSDALPEQAVQGSHYRFAWNGKSIARLYDFTEKQDIDRADIFSAIKQAA